MTDRMISISRNHSVEIDLREAMSDLILCRLARDSAEEQLSGQNIDLSHCQIVEAASTQINMIEEGNGNGIISELMLSTIPNELVRGTVLPRISTEISLLAHNFDELPIAAREISDMIMQRAKH